MLYFISFSQQPLHMGIMDSVLHRQNLRLEGLDRIPSVTDDSDPGWLTAGHTTLLQGVTVPSLEGCDAYLLWTF